MAFTRTRGRKPGAGVAAQKIILRGAVSASAEICCLLEYLANFLNSQTDHTVWECGENLRNFNGRNDPSNLIRVMPRSD
jgi:hypothetical protein